MWVESAGEHRCAVTLGGRRTVRKLHLQLEQAAFPDGFFAARDSAVPALQVESALRSLHGSCDETEWVILAPCFAEDASAQAKQC